MQLCVIEGDGVGHEVIPAAVRVLKALAPKLEVIPAEAGFETLQRTGTPLPEETCRIAAQIRAVLFGAAESPSYPVEGYFSPIIALRQQLSAYANIRPTRYLPVATARPGVDFIIVRENTEDLYTGAESVDESGDSGVAQKIITRAATERVARRAYKLALENERQRVTIVHKANILPKSDGLFRRVAYEVAERFPEIETDELLVDTAAYWMVKSPARFDVILTSNLYGDILSDMGAAWGGGLGLAPALNLGDDAATPSRFTEPRQTSPARTSLTRPPRSSASRFCCAITGGGPTSATASRGRSRGRSPTAFTPRMSNLAARLAPTHSPTRSSSW